MLAQIGKGVLRREGSDVALIGYGTMVQVHVDNMLNMLNINAELECCLSTCTAKQNGHML